jgi:hypothetical protein
LFDSPVILLKSGAVIKGNFPIGVAVNAPSVLFGQRRSPKAGLSFGEEQRPLFDQLLLGDLISGRKDDEQLLENGTLINRNHNN